MMQIWNIKYFFRQSLATLALLTLIFSASNCGFVRNARVTKEYIDVATPDSEGECLVTWPIHVVLIPIMAIIDQTIHTFEIIPEAFVDAKDYLFLRGNGNNIMLESTIAVPKTVATPIIFVVSYIGRWFFPFDSDDRPFEMEDE